MEENIEQQVGWNLSSAIIAEIGALLSQASVAYTSGKIPRCFYFLKAIRMRLAQHLTDKELEVFLKLESLLFKLCKNNTKGTLSYWLEKYNTLIMRRLEKYGYLIQHKQDRRHL